MGSNVEKLHVQPQPLEGCLDALTEGKIFGWAWDRERPEDRLVIELRQGDTILATGVADRRRADLAGSGIGDGAYAFEIALPSDCASDALAVHVNSPSTDKTTVLTLRPSPQPDDLPGELQRLSAGMHGVSLVQKQTANMVQGLLREIRESGGSEDRLAVIEQRLSELSAAQQALGKQFETTEVFLMRFDGLLRQLDSRLSVRPAMDASAAFKVVAVFAAVVGAVAAVTLLAL